MYRMLVILIALFLTTLAYGERRFCEYVIDGDTVILDGGERVRLIGVDAPEIPHGKRPGEAGGYEASRYLRGLVEGKTITLKYDEEAKDSYGRTLGYLYLGDGKNINEEMIRSGHAKAMRFFNYRLKERFFKVEAKAEAAR